MLIHNADITGSLLVNGVSYNTGSFTGSFTGVVSGVSATASYVEYTNVANKPALVSGSSQISFDGIVDKPTLISGSAQVTYSGLTGIPANIVSGSAQIAALGYATTGSNGFNGSQSITGSLTVTGQVVAQTLNVQQVTSSIVYSSGSNIFGNSLANTQQFTGSVSINGSLGVSGVSTFNGIVGANGASEEGWGLKVNQNLKVENNNGTTVLQVNDTATGGKTWSLISAGSGNAHSIPNGTFYLRNSSDSLTALSVTSTGNLGLGVTPSAWMGGSAALQVIRGGLWHDGSGYISLFNNAYYDGSNWRYIASTTATNYAQVNGNHQWFQAPSGTNPGDVISFSQPMTLDSSGRLLLGFTTNQDGARLQVSGTATISGDITTSGSVYSSGNLAAANGNQSANTISATLFLGNRGYFSGATVGAAQISAISTGTFWYSGTAMAFYTNPGPDVTGTNNIERMRITSGGNVGIGVDTPQTQLHLNGTLTFTEPGFNTVRLNQIASSHSDGSSANNNLRFLISDGSGSTSERMRVNGAGNVGIGSTSITNGTTFGGGGQINRLKVQSTNYTCLEINGSTSGGSIQFTYGTNLPNQVAGLIGYNYANGAANEFAISNVLSGPLILGTSNTERMRINSGGYLKLKTVSSVYTTTTHRLDDYQLEQGSVILVSGNASSADTIILYSVGQAGQNAAATAIAVGRNSSTSRSINAGGTINASGADYAEYMTKAIADNIAKGDIVGINSEGKLTNIFNDAISFAVKSTDPAYVGNDSWGSANSLNKPISLYTEEELQQYKATNEAIRATVDRIAFSGQVPCNVTGSNVGDYIIPIQLENGKIGGQAISNPTFEQYQIAVGKVWKIMEDGRAWIAVKIG